MPGQQEGEMPPEEAGGGGEAGVEELLASMAGGGEMGGEMGGEEMPPEMGGEMPPEMGGEMPPEMGGMGGEAPPEMGGMGDEAALQQLAMALMELGIDPAQLAAVGQPEGAKIASAVQDWKRQGKFAFTEAAEKTAERKVRDYMKGFITELYGRSQR